MHQLDALATPKTLLVGRNYELKHRNPKAKRDDERYMMNGVE